MLALPPGFFHSLSLYFFQSTARISPVVPSINYRWLSSRLLEFLPDISLKVLPEVSFEISPGNYFCWHCSRDDFQSFSGIISDFSPRFFPGFPFGMHKGFIADIYHEVFLANTELEVFYGIPLFSKILCSDRSEIFRGFSGITPKAISRTTICPGVLGVPFGISLTDDLGDY